MSYLKLNNVQNKLSQSDISDNDDPLAELRNSDFIGCFSGDVDLVEQSEQIVKDIISKRKKRGLNPFSFDDYKGATSILISAVTSACNLI
ncbi:MAG: hypothetical protein IGQ45_09150 [Cyanobacterium sp. T60_A2020_053]|nr:hypothetical protein [Cyanobacterium sp. T60_A2020_053]